MCTLHDSNIQSVMFSERKKKLHLHQNPAIWFIWICINITNGLDYFLSGIFVKKKKKNVAPIYFIKSEMKWLDTFYTIFVFSNTKSYSKRHWKPRRWNLEVLGSLVMQKLYWLKINFFSPSYLSKGANIAGMPLYAQTSFGISSDFTNIQHFKNMYQRQTLKYYKNSFSIFCT